MKGSKSISWCWILFAIATAVLWGGAYFSVKSFLHISGCPGDLRFRYNESLCAHTGINPFHVWNHDIKVEGFRGWKRPDLPFDTDESKLMVHSYPPWHMAYTWFYGCMPWVYVVGIVFTLYGFSMSSLFRLLKDNSPKEGREVYWALLSFWIIPPFLICFKYGNYGILCAGLLAFILAKLARNSQILAGIGWGLMMIKPQIATLLFFPLLFQKKYVAIGTAILMCLIATLWPAYVYRESPLDLILQVPLIGAPYELNVVFSFLKSRAPVSYMYLKGGLTLCCVVLCAYSSWIWRNAKNPIYRYAPVAFFFPLWLYSQVYDSIASWPLYFLFAMILTKTESGSRLHRLMVGYIMLSAMSVMFPIAWELCVKLKVLNPSGIGWVFHAVQNFINMVLFLLGAWMLLKGPQIVEKEPEHV